MFDVEHMNGHNALVLFDLGAGLGKLVSQAFLNYPNLQKVVGVR